MEEESLAQLHNRRGQKWVGQVVARRVETFVPDEAVGVFKHKEPHPVCHTQTNTHKTTFFFFFLQNHILKNFFT